MAEGNKQWYVLRAISGKEAKVKEVLDAAIKNTDLGKYVSQVLIPTEPVYVQRNGKKVLKERTLYSGYVFIEARLTGEVIYELQNAEPEALRESEVKKMLGAADAIAQGSDLADMDFIVGESVTVTFGPFKGFRGVVREVNRERKKLKVEVKIFERPVDLELENSQVERE